MAEDNDTTQACTPGALLLVNAALQLQQSHKHRDLGVNHWLLALLMRHGPMAEALSPGLEAGRLERDLQAQLQAGQTGEPLASALVTAQALAHAQARGLAQAARRGADRKSVG